jgi:Mn-containing catalase
VPFDCSHVYASGNLAADMYCNVAAESTGRTLAVRLYNSTSDRGMQDMLSYLIARADGDRGGFGAIRALCRRSICSWLSDLGSP